MDLEKTLECQRYAFKWLGEPSISNEKKYYNEFERKGEVFRITDNVEVFEAKGTEVPNVGHITLLWEDEEGIMWCRVRWFLRHKETLCNCGGSIHKAQGSDLFLTEFCEDFRVLCIKGRCQVFHKSKLLEHLGTTKVPKGLLKAHQYCCKQQIGDVHKSFAPVRFYSQIFDDHTKIECQFLLNETENLRILSKRRKNNHECHICHKDSTGGVSFPENCQHAFCRGCLWKRFRAKSSHNEVRSCPCCNPSARRKCPCGKNKTVVQQKDKEIQQQTRRIKTADKKSLKVDVGPIPPKTLKSEQQVKKHSQVQARSTEPSTKLPEGKVAEVLRLERVLDLLATHEAATEIQKEKIESLKKMLQESKLSPVLMYEKVDALLLEKCFGDNVGNGS